jgi:hypothetical protein
MKTQSVTIADISYVGLMMFMEIISVCSEWKQWKTMNTLCGEGGKEHGSLLKQPIVIALLQKVNNDFLTQ